MYKRQGLKFLVAASIEQIDLRTLDVELEEVDPPRVRATTKSARVIISTKTDSS